MAFSGKKSIDCCTVVCCVAFTSSQCAFRNNHYGTQSHRIRKNFESVITQQLYDVFEREIQRAIGVIESWQNGLPEKSKVVNFDISTKDGNTAQAKKLLKKLEQRKKISLSDIIDATINHQPLEIDYISANGNYHKHILHPYFVKQYNGRWYLFGLDNDEERIKNLAFDRIQGFVNSNHVFRKNENIDFNTYFDNVVGVTVPYTTEAELVDIILRFSPKRFKYVTSKPIHKSQVTISEEECTISLKLYNTLELEQQIFSFGPDVEVISPLWFRDKFAEKIAECMKKYFPVQNNCTDNRDLCTSKNDV